MMMVARSSKHRASAQALRSLLHAYLRGRHPSLPWRQALQVDPARQRERLDLRAVRSKELIGRPLRHDLPVCDQHDAIRHLVRRDHVVRDDERRDAVSLAHALDQAVDDT
jgi:hypothetical protein